MTEFKKGDLVRVTLKTGPYAAMEGTVKEVHFTGWILVELRDEEHYFTPYELEVFDPAPVVIKLNGSFSGLWTCELCGKTGTDCTCEHFARNDTRGRDKTFSEAELAAELWYTISQFYSINILEQIFEDDADGDVELYRERMYTVQRLADEKDYREEDNGPLRIR